MIRSNLFRIGIDTGGTFTDVVGLRDGELRTWKLPSTPRAFEEAVLAGGLRVSGGEPAEWLHSSTVATNALLERKGARCALVTTRGFRDVLEIGRQNRPDLYALEPRRNPPLIPGGLRFELSERVNARGEILLPLDPGEFPDLLRRLRTARVESVAVLFLFSFLRPEHEKAVGDFLRREGFAVSLSHEILPEFREVERGSTTVINAYVCPAMQSYLQRLQPSAPRLAIMQSNGGVMSPARAGRQAVNTLLSGPAAGLAGACFVARAGDPANGTSLITFDMGGTSTDVALVLDHPRLSTGMTLDGFPVGVPMVEVHTVGAGGGSIARVDVGGALQVGPASAGADPGPACYGRGGPATVTDAHVVLGHVRAEWFLQGRVTLHVERAFAALAELGRAMGGISAEDAARGVLRLANLHMENAIRVISVQRGHDPADFTLLGFGGAGGLHVFALADALNMRRVLVPCHPGVLSALGAAVSPLRQDISRTWMRPWREADLPLLEAEIEALRGELRRRFTEDGFTGTPLRFSTRLDLRYQGQSHELGIEIPDDDLPGAPLRFHAEHRRSYGHADAEGVVECVTLRVTAASAPPSCDIPPLPERAPGDPPAEISPGVWRREHLRRGDRLRGPALVLEDFHTLLVPEGWELRLDRVGNLLGEKQ